MKKILTIILINLTFFSMCIKTCANCDMSLIDEEQINFTKLNKKGVQSFTQTIEDKEVTVWRYEHFSDINYYLNRNINDKIKELITNENRKIDPNLLGFLLDKAYDFIAKTSKEEERALNEISSKISSKDLERLSKDEISTAANEGKKDGFLSAGKGLAVGGFSGLGIWGAAKLLASKSTGIIKEIAGCIISKPVAGVVTIGSTFALAIGGFAYNKFYILPISNKIRNSIEVYKDIYGQAREKVISHRWLENNVLITAVPKNSSCMKGYANFHNIDGVNFNKPQKAINWEFAKSECKFLNEDHDECYQKAKETIECLWENQDDPSQCRVNPYYNYKGNCALKAEL